MKRITMVGFFVGLLSLSMNAQFIQSSGNQSGVRSTEVENKRGPDASIQELLARYESLGKQIGSVSEYFTKEEQRQLRNHFKAQKLGKANDARQGMTNNFERGAQLPAAFFNNAGTTLSENTGVASTGERNPNVVVPFTGTYYSNRAVDVIYDNGPYFNTPGNPDVSLLQTSLGMSTLGAGAQITAGNSVADDVVLTDDYTVSSIDLFAYQTGSTAPSVNAVYVRIWDADPSGAGANIIWGDLTTNIFGGAVYANANRASETTPGDTSRQINRVTALTTGLTLNAGTYWIEYTFGGTGSSGPWAPPIAILGQTTTGNSIQNQNGTWFVLEDGGTFTPQGLPFVMYGELVGGGGGTGSACSQSNPENNFENAFGSSQEALQIMATDINVPADTNFTLNTITVNIWSNPGSTINNADIVFYDNAGGVPGATRTTQSAVVPTSQTYIGTNFGFDISEVVFEVTPEMLEGEAGATKVYWVSLYLEMSSGPGYIGATSASIVGLDHAYSPDGGASWIINAGWDSVYIFDGECEDIGGGGEPGPLTTVYGIDNATQDFIGFGISAPTNAEVFGTSPITVNFENAGAIDPANPTTGYVLDNGGQFFSFDVTTGFYSALGSIPGDWVGMEFDRNTGILYATKLESLYIIDPIGISATLVGSMGLPAGSLTVSLAIDGDGVGYVHDLVADAIYSINLATGAGTLVGNTGFDANFGQGMCYDPTSDTVYMSAFNSTTFMAEWRSVNTATGMTTLIGAITTVNDSAPQVAWSSVGETLDPPTCPKPTFLTVTDITETSAVLNWVAEPNASNGYIWYVFEGGADPMTATPVATGTTGAGVTTATANGLQNAMTYDFYVVADCASDGLSSYAGPVSFATMITPPACGGKFYDTGGPDGNYGDNENTTTVISPDAPGDFVTVTFTSFNVEATWDALYVYDGPNTTYPMISSGNPATNSGFPAGGYYGTTIPGPFVATNPEGALTFVFRSETSFNYEGWEADVTCGMYPPPNDKIANSIDVAAIGFPYTDPAVRMPAATIEDGNPVDCDLTGAYGVWYHFTTTQAGTASASIETPAGASNVTFYTAPGAGAVETDLARVQQSSNPCNPGTSATINTEAEQTYYVFVMNSGAVTDIQIDVTTIGISDNVLAGFNYYPNPTNGILNLSSKEIMDSASVYNLLGQKVLETSLKANTASLDISTFSSGTYIMKISINGEIGTYKLIKQ